MVEDNNSSKTPEDDIPTITSQAGFTGSQAIGNYKILRKIGEGGMGAVYEAEQEKPVRRKVALKLIKWGMDTKSVVARFESERQALALMNHPNIAKVYDAGATDQGRPYFVMEHVQGIPITQYCDTHRLTTKERLNLFISVCEAVQHAHQKGIIHRDIKASNVLVAIQDDKPVPKIIDFGVAKATASRLTEHTVYTEFGQMIGTPEYMSPEQAEMTGLDIDTRTDVYSLGVLLYELLVGALPFDPRELRKSGFDEIRRKIREEEPSKPSTRVSTLGETTTDITESRKTELPALQRQLRGDLDWITMKALEKDRTRRYQSALELAADINRHMSNEPVLASQPSTLYRMKKFVRRHKVGVAAGFIVSAALISGIIGTTIGLIRATKAEAKAKEEAETAQKVSDFLVGLFEVSDPSEARGNTITAREILDKGAESIEKGLKDQPLVQARLMSTMGEVYEHLGLYDKALPLLEQALTIRQSFLREDHLDVAESLNRKALLLHIIGRYEEALPLYERSLAIRENALGPDHPDVAESLNNIAKLLNITGKHEEALPLYERSLAIRENALGPDHPDVAESLNSIAMLLKRTGRYEEARPLLERSLAIRENALGPDHPEVAESLNNMADLLWRTGRYEEARPLLERSLAINEKAFGPDHIEVAESLNNIALLLWRTGKHEEARPLLERSLAINEKALGSNHREVAASLHNKALLLLETGRYEEALPLFERSLAIYEKTFGPDHPDLETILFNIAYLLWQTGKNEEARPLLERSLAINEKTFGLDHPAVANSLDYLALLLSQNDKKEEALQLYERSLAIREKALGPDHPDVANSLTHIASLLSQICRYEEARPLYERSLIIKEKTLGPDHPGVLKILYNLACLSAVQSNPETALDYLRQALERGFANRIILDDPDLDSLRGNPEFEAIVNEVKKRIEKE